MYEDNLSKHNSVKNKLENNQDKFTTTSQETYELRANATGMNTAKNRQFFWNLEKTTKTSKRNKKPFC